MSKFGDIYGHDARMAPRCLATVWVLRIRGVPRRSLKLLCPRGDQGPWDDAASNDIVGSIIRLLGN